MSQGRTIRRARRDRLRTRAFGLTLSVLAAAAGCSDYRWTSEYEEAESRARRQDKHLFIFYKSWLSNDSNRMHGDVLSDPSVATHLQDTVNVLLEKDSSPEYGRYMLKYGVTSPPAFVIVAPDGAYQVRTGFIPRDRFVEFIDSAKAPRPPRPIRPPAAAAARPPPRRVP